MISMQKCCKLRPISLLGSVLRFLVVVSQSSGKYRQTDGAIHTTPIPACHLNTQGGINSVFRTFGPLMSLRSPKKEFMYSVASVTNNSTLDILYIIPIKNIYYFLLSVYLPVHRTGLKTSFCLAADNGWVFCYSAHEPLHSEM